MRAPLSILIPTLNAGPALPATLACLMEGLSEGLVRELVVSDGGSTDDTLRIASATGAEVVAGAPGRGGQLRRGVARCSGSWLLVLHADTQLAPGWTQAVRRHLEQDPHRAGYFRLKFRASGPGAGLVAGGGNLRARLFGLPYGDQGLLISRQQYEATGGYPDLPLMEDVVLARALRGRLKPLDAVASTGAERYLRNGWLRQSLGNQLRLLRFATGARAADLARHYDAQ